MLHLVEKEGNKENETVNRLFAKSTALRIPIDSSLENHFGITQPFSLVGLRIPFDYIDEEEKVKGDIDVLFIQLSKNIGDYLKPIHMNIQDIDNIEITAFEVKVGYLNSDAKLKSIGLFPGNQTSKKYSDKQLKFRNQAEKLCTLGFDKVGLMYAIPTDPMTDSYLGFESWNIASDAVYKVENIIDSLLYTKKEDDFSTFYLPIGTIKNRLEHLSGVLQDFRFKHFASRIIKKETGFKKKLLTKITELFPIEINPNNLPILLLACSKCINIYLSKSDPYKKCPKCHSNPK